MSIARNLAALLDTSGDVVAGALDNAGGGGIGSFTGSSVAISSDDTALAVDDGTDNKNIGMGDGAGQRITSGYENIVLGEFAGERITSGKFNVILGTKACRGGNGSRDVFVGSGSGGNTSGYTSGGSNAVLGYEAMKYINYAYNSVAIGREALLSSAGHNNVAIGYKAGEDLTSGNNNVFIGDQVGTSISPSGAVTTASNTICIGNNSITSAYVKVSWTVTSDERDKADITPLVHGLSVIEAIIPINYYWDNRSDYWVTTPEVRDDSDVITQEAVTTKHDSDGSLKQSDDLRIGLSAQNVKASLDGVGYIGNAVVNSQDPENLKITETNLIPFLVNAIKELSEKVKILENK